MFPNGKVTISDAEFEAMHAHDTKQAAKLTEQRAELHHANEYALRLVLSLAARFPAVEGFHAFPDLYGRLSQIDNMTCKLPLGFGSPAAEPENKTDDGR